MKTEDDSKCCHTNLIPFSEDCCHGNGYDATKQVCADHPTVMIDDVTMAPSCGEGNTCELIHAPNAACDRLEIYIELKSIFDC